MYILFGNMGQNIKRFRHAKNMTLEEVGVQMNVSRGTIARWESGIHQPITERMETLCFVLDVTPNDLFLPEVEAIVPRGTSITSPPNSS